MWRKREMKTQNQNKTENTKTNSNQNKTENAKQNAKDCR